MIDVRKFIERLNKEQSNYTSPELSQNIANALESLSTDIYTDSKRFIYEMLQNADDASNRSGKLEIQIQIIGQYLVISHQGEKFTEIDIESICSVGDGNKKGDENKTGFKGIGFKSIFSHSDYVIINSGDYCFSFDKNHWENYWSNNWGKQQDWKKQRVSKGKEANVKMPWQIIPIWTYLPKELAFVKKFNVSTIVKYDDIEKLHKELFDLFSNTQILLFLRSREVKVTITKAVSFTIEKVRHGETIKLRKNGQDISEWLFKSVPLDVDQLTKNIMENDIRIPEKLRQSNKTEIFFAVQLEDGKIKTADKENRLIFTYLPTSVNYDFPFLVNASFLTDAGRQHLHEDLYWNIWL
ncbi:MAG: sacsin N-terminal ATP-binding-like domain-containing protein, partial [Dolichospermum sp.]